MLIVDYQICPGIAMSKAPTTKTFFLCDEFSSTRIFIMFSRWNYIPVRLGYIVVLWFGSHYINDDLEIGKDVRLKILCVLLALTSI